MIINKSKDQKTSFKEAYMNLLLKVCTVFGVMDTKRGQNAQFCAPGKKNNQLKILIFSLFFLFILFFSQNVDCGCMLEPPCHGC